MLLYATEFPARSGATLANFLTVCRTWLVGSPHYPFKTLPEFAPTDGEILDLSRDGHDLRVGLIEEEAQNRAGLRHVWTESARRTWTTEVIASEDADGLWVSVNVGCDVLEPGATPPIPKKPYIIKRLFEQLGGGNDGGPSVRDSPTHLQETDIDRAVALLTGTLSNTLPVVYVSSDFTGHPEVDVDHLARLLGGLAHVLVEPSRRFSIQVGRRVGGINPWGGAVGLFWPGAKGRRSKYLPRFYSSSYDLVADVENGVRLGWLYWRSPRGNSWAYLNEAISLRKLEALRQAQTESPDEYIAAFDQENKALRDQLQRAESRNLYLEDLVRTLQERDVMRGDVTFAAGNEQEFYPGEARDAVLRSLQETTGTLSQGSRREVLIADFIAANDISDTASRIEAAIKAILGKTDRVGPTEIKQLEELGFHVTDDGRHYKAVFGGDARLTFSVFKTASDHRSGKNLASDICKMLFGR